MAERIDTGNDAILAEISGHVGRLTINRPGRHNAVDTAMWRAFPRAIDAFETNREVRVILVRGAGRKAFCAGADIAEFDATRATPDASRAYDALGEAAYGRLRRSPLPTVALIHGICFGGGLGIATSCDLRIAGESSLYSIPAGRLGLAYPHELLMHLTRVAGPALAKQLLLTAARIDARQAHISGLVNEVVADDALDARTEDICSQIASNAPLTLRAAKYVIDATTRDPASIDMGEVSQRADACFASADYAEGRRAFMEKRKPQFSGS